MFLRYFIFLILAGCSIQMTAQAELPEDFYEITVNDGWNFPAGLTFDDTGRIFVWEKEGLVYVVDTTGVRFPAPLLDISEEVLNYKDLGMLGFVLDPDFLENGYFYTMYVVDGHHLRYYGTPEYHPDSSTVSATIGRLTRFTADVNNGFETLVPDSRKVLIGESISTGIPIMHEVHAPGTLLFGTDGTLLASMGDGTTKEGNFAAQGVQEGILKPKEDIGAYRAQLIDSHSGKILRIDPETGDGVASNPFYDENAPRSPRSRVWALGLRNPYRMTLRPETGSHFEADGQPGILYVSDVGSGGWEEINVVTEAGQNFGWPLYEGLFGNWEQAQHRTQNQDAPNPLFDNNNCPQQFFDFQHLLLHESLNDPVFPNPCDNNQMIPDNDYLFMHRRAAISYNNNNWNGPTRTITPGFDDTGNATEISVLDNASPIESDTFTGVASIIGAFYTGNSFPEEYQNALYSTDYSGWVRRFYFNENQQLTRVAPFAENLIQIVHLEMNPHDGCLYYFRTWETKLFKICYGGNPPPVAVAEADVYYGASPLTVYFDASTSFDPNELPFSYSWDFGNGETSDSRNPIREFTAPDSKPYSFEVTLTVTDSLGASGSDKITISLNNTPPQVNITSFDDGDTYPVSGYTLLPLIADVSDNEHPKDDLIYEWQTFLHHGDHFHTDPVDNTPKTSTRISPLGCGDEVYYHEIRLKVTDPAGLSAEDSGFLYPNCNPPFFELEHFNATADQQKNMLSWTTLMENGTERFEIHRSIGDFNFIKIGTTEAMGEAATTTTYDFSDTQPLNGTNAYRLKIYDSDGNYEYSKIVSVEFPAPTPLPNFHLYPNPTNDLIHLNYTDINDLATFALYNNLGQKVYKSTWQVSGAATYTISVKDYQKGMYIYVLDDGNTFEAGKLILQ